MAQQDCIGYHTNDLTENRCAHLNEDGTCAFFKTVCDEEEVPTDTRTET